MVKWEKTSKLPALVWSLVRTGKRAYWLAKVRCPFVCRSRATQRTTVERVWAGLCLLGVRLATWFLNGGKKAADGPQGGIAEEGQMCDDVAFPWEFWRGPRDRCEGKLPSADMRGQDKNRGRRTTEQISLHLPRKLTAQLVASTRTSKVTVASRPDALQRQAGSLRVGGCDWVECDL